MTNPKNDEPENAGELLEGLFASGLPRDFLMASMGALTYRVMENFAAASPAQLAEHHEIVEKVKAAAAALESSRVLGVALVVVRLAEQEGETDLTPGLAQHLAGDLRVIRPALALGMMNVEEALKRVDAEADAANAVYPVCDDCGRRHPPATH